MKIIFAGTPEFSAHILQSLLDREQDEIIAVYTQPDRPAGRGQKFLPSPVKQLAQEHGIAVYQPQNLKKTDDQRTIAKLHADVMVVVAYGVILPKEVLSSPEYGCLNIHASLLPRWRGAAPIQRAILAGDAETGICIMQMDEGLDTGDVLHQKSLSIEVSETGASLHDKLIKLANESIHAVLDDLPYWQQQAVKQDDKLATYAHKLNKSEAKIDWHKPAQDIVRQVNAFNSWPIANCEAPLGKNNSMVILRIWQAHSVEEIECTSETSTIGEVVYEDKNGVVVRCVKGFLVMTKLQLPGKKALHVNDFVNSYSLLNSILQ